MKHSPIICLSVLSLCLSGCIDDNYDLSDIDTNVQINVKDLVIPVNLDVIKLSNVLDIDENDEHIKIIDGQYCYFSDGDFTSNPISIPAISVNVPSINPAYINIHHSLPITVVPDVATDIALDIKTSTTTQLSLQAANISDDIVSIGQIGADAKLLVTLNFGESLKTVAKKLQLKGLQIQLPKGFVIEESDKGNYDSESGIFTLANVESSTNSVLEIPLKVKGVENKGYFDGTKHVFNLSTAVGIQPSGQIVLKGEDLNVGANLPKDFQITINFKIDSFTANTFTGEVKHSLSDVNIPDVSLNDLPDVLSQPGTNLVVENPCIYLNVNNPLQEYGLYAQTDLQITALRENEADQLFNLDSPLKIGQPIQTAGAYNFCLSPAKPSSYDSEFAQGCTHSPFSSLKNVLAGNGMPQTLKVKLVNPEVPVQQVADFVLGQNYEGVNGNYKFVAPFQLSNGSQIVYSDLVDDWGSDDLDAMTITTLEINMSVTTNIPVKVDFVGYPVDRNGIRINNVRIEGATIEANANNQQVCIKTTGSISDFGGIEFVATATATGGEALSPDMTITLSNVRPKVSGYYQDEL